MTDQHRIDHAKGIAMHWIDAYFGKACTAEEAGAAITQTMRTFRTSTAAITGTDAPIGEIVRGLPPVDSNVQPHPATQQAGTKA